MAIAPLNRQVLPLHNIRQMLPLALKVQQVAHAQSLLHIFIRINGSDSPPGRTKLLSRQTVLLQTVHQLVIRHTDRGLVADLQILRRDGYAALTQTLHLAAQMLQVNDHAGPQHIDCTVPQDAGGHQVQDEFALVVDHRVTGVVAALVTDHYVIALAEQVHHAALAFVAPVDAYDCSKHCFVPQNKIVYFVPCADMLKNCGNFLAHLTLF